ncbi:histone-lysine N-methyltransferase family member SUVH2-like [Apium graveolens]|uniref:histone-lysine N-methyltransferase family member SUVH2-like n=1 Tax=Apium graveolens TaxID=4045 RepID=UPI003D7B6622
MGSLLHFPDLNTAATTNNNSPNKIIQPKLEPLDSVIDSDSLAPPPGIPFPLSQTLIQNPNPNSNSTVYSEFSRISELFKTAFSDKCPQNDVVLSPNALAIVPVDEKHQRQGNVSNVGRVRAPQHSSELVRVTDLSIEDEKYFREVVRKTRMLYENLRVYGNLSDEREMVSRRSRNDLKASAVMRERGLWLNRDKRIVGAIPGVEIGDVFFFRMELCVVGIHEQPQAGIDYLPSSRSSNGEPIATSIIVSGGYEDDVDTGDVIIYTGHGGQDKGFRQCANQKLECGNLGLERSMHYGIEVRVVRGFKYEGSVSGKVYVYDGLHKVVDCWFDVGKSGFGVYKYKIVRLENQSVRGSLVLRFAQNLRIRPLEARPRGYVCMDMSMKKENVPVLLFNDIDGDHEPLAYQYLVRSVIPPYVYQFGSGGGCNCVAGCFRDCVCAMKNGGEFAYDEKGILIQGKPVIFECGPHCTCPPTCRNRVSQKGVRNTFEVFRSRETGWGVRSLDLIQAGAFLCEYAGVVLTQDQARVFSMAGDNLVYPKRFPERWQEWGDISQVSSNYVRPSHPSIPPLDFAMDVSSMRNVACYMSHSRSPNVMVQFVLYDHNNVIFPRLMLFALENIPPLRELSLDYGVAEEWSPKLAICN